MIRILANDGIDEAGKAKLEAAGYQVDTTKVPQAELGARIADYDGLCVRSATQVDRDIIDRGRSGKLRAIGRGGVGLDNIDIDYAAERGVAVFNTPGASSRAVAELAFAHIFALARYLYRSNAELPAGSDFKKLKKDYAAGIQLQGLTLGVVGLGRIGREVARIGLGLGMRVLGSDSSQRHVDLDLQIEGLGTPPVVRLNSMPLEDLIEKVDVLTLHIPAQGGDALLGADLLRRMKPTALVINTARGGLIDEAALLEALKEGRIGGAGLDVFDNEPHPLPELLQHPRTSVSPHIGAATDEAQRLIGLELADQLIDVLG